MYPQTFRTREPLLANGRPAKSFAVDPDDPDNKLLKLQEAAELCSVDTTFIRKAVAHRELRMVVLGPKTHRIRVSELHRWWRSRQTKAMIM
jgi:excisionase family DNA binding protein